ncbi:MAG TPA: PAS domain S-box protein [bacterium]|nr:PAS domain S-box protein [bacterium]
MNNLRQRLADLQSENAALQKQIRKCKEEIAALKGQLASQADKHELALYRTLADFSLGAIYIFQEGKFQYINDSFTRISGYTLEEANRGDYLGLIHPDHRELVRWTTEKALTGETEDLPPEPEIKIFHKNGSIRWIRFLPTLIEYQGKPAILANVIDITEQKAAEALLQEQRKQYKEAMNNIDQALLILNDQHIVTFVNEAAAKLCDTDPEMLQGNPFMNLFPEESTAAIAEYLSRTIDGEPQRFRGKLQIPDTDSVPVQIILRPLKDKSGQQGGAFAYIHPLDKSALLETETILPGSGEAEGQGKPLHRDLITICAHCKKIKDAGDTWRTLEEYFSRTFHVHFSHTICPVCLEDLYPGLMPDRE